MKYLMLLLFYFPPDSIKQKVNLRVFNSFSKELFTDSLWIQDGTTLSVCDRKALYGFYPMIAMFMSLKSLVKAFRLEQIRITTVNLRSEDLKFMGKKRL